MSPLQLRVWGDRFRKKGLTGLIAVFLAFCRKAIAKLQSFTQYLLSIKAIMLLIIFRNKTTISFAFETTIN